MTPEAQQKTSPYGSDDLELFFEQPLAGRDPAIALSIDNELERPIHLNA